MKKKLFCGYFICLAASAAVAQQTNDVDALKRQLQEATEKFDKALQEHRKIIDDLNRRLQQVQVEQAKATGAVAAAAPSPAVAATPWRPTDPIRLVGDKRAYVNISFDGLFAAGSSTASDIEELQPGGHDPNQRGFTVQNLETTFEGMVDPYFRGQANIVYQIDSEGESLLEVEEAYLETLALPGNLQVKGGQYFTEFGRLNPTHPHSWAFVDQPLVNGRFLGGDGLRNPGARVSWLMPTPFYSELFLSVQNSHGETASSFRSAGDAHGGEEEEGEVPLAFRHADNDRGLKHVQDLLFVPRYAVSFDLTDSQTALFGASAAFGPNSRGGEDGGDTDTQIYGLDLTWKWKSPRHTAGFPFVAWQTEAMLRRYDVGAFDWADETEGQIIDESTGNPANLTGETLTDYGFYTQLLYGFRKGWVAGLRFDYVTGDRADYERMNLSLDGEPLGRDLQRAEGWRISPNLTWYPTEFSKLRLQYNYDDRKGIGEDHSVWLQFEFLLGSHGAHKF
ncbi:MAG: TonB-dependent receptor [Verrucomicrobia subdivision 3 bacterium]|nr:TonB-dependent receptor [Limisphaerales bacterium]